MQQMQIENLNATVSENKSLDIPINLEWFPLERREDLSLLICPFCKKFFNFPVMLTCGCIYCQGCFNGKMGKKCISGKPNCQNSVIMDEHLDYIEDMIHSKKEKCKNAGCYNIISLTDYVNHLTVCPKEILECKYRCGQKICREGIHQHEENCPFKIIECEDCHERFKTGAMKNHSFMCPMKNVNCILCDKVILRKDIPIHMERYCPNMEKQCFYAPVGCSSRMIASELKKHCCDSKEDHLNKFSSFVVSCAKDFEESKGKITELLKTNEILANRMMQRISEQKDYVETMIKGFEKPTETQKDVYENSFRPVKRNLMNEFSNAPQYQPMNMKYRMGNGYKKNY